MIPPNQPGNRIPEDTGPKKITPITPEFAHWVNTHPSGSLAWKEGAIATYRHLASQPGKSLQYWINKAKDPRIQELEKQVAELKVERGMRWVEYPRHKPKEIGWYVCRHDPEKCGYYWFDGSLFTHNGFAINIVMKWLDESADLSAEIQALQTERNDYREALEQIDEVYSNYFTEYFYRQFQATLNKYKTP